MSDKKSSPEQLTSISTMLTTLAALLISIIGLQYIGQDLIAPILMAIFLAILMLPIFQWFKKRGHSSNTSLFLMIITFIITVGSLVVFVTWSFSLLRESLGAYTQELQSTISQLTQNQNVEEAVTTYITPDMIMGILPTIFGSIGSLVMFLIVIPILAMLILLQIDSSSLNNSKNTPHSSKMNTYRKFAQSVTIYAFGRLKVNTITGLLFFIALTFLDVEFALVWGILTIFLSFIPYLGIIIAGTAPTLIALTSQGWVTALLVVVSIIIINLIAENILDPHIQGKGNKLSTPTVIIALIFWTWMLGALGAIMAVPLTVLLKTIFEEYKETAWLASIMEGNYTPPDPDTQSSIKKTTSFLKDLVPHRQHKKSSN